MAFCAQFTAEGEANSEKIYPWIAERSPDGAERWKTALEQAVSRIVDSADTYGSAPESDAFSEPVREILFKTDKGRKYRALFVVRGDEASVISVRGPGQDLIGPDDVTLPD